MGSVLPALVMIINFGVIITVIIIMVRLFIRLVKAIEKIADSVEDCCKGKMFQSD